METASGEDITVSLGNAGLLSSCMGWEATFTGGGEVVSTGKEESSELRGSMSSA